MAVAFINIDRETPSMLPAGVHDYIPEDHLARFVVEIVTQLDLSEIEKYYAGRGSHPPGRRR